METSLPTDIFSTFKGISAPAKLTVKFYATRLPQGLLLLENRCLRGYEHE